MLQDLDQIHKFLSDFIAESEHLLTVETELFHVSGVK